MVVTLDESLRELRRGIAAARHQRILLMILSPTCAGCVRGARSLEDLLDAGRLGGISVQVIWGRFLSGDDDAAVNAAAGALGEPVARHLFDPGLKALARLTRLIDPNWLQKVAEAMPPSHPLSAAIGQAAVREGIAPLWDAAFVFPRDGSWLAGEIPAPLAFTKQLAFRGGDDPSRTGYFVKGSFATSPLETDWLPELESLVRLPR